MEQLKGKILAIDDNEDILFALKLLLKPLVEKITTLSSPARVLDLLKVEEYDVILLDMNFTRDASSGKEGFDWLAKILEFDPKAVVVFITAYGDSEKAVQAIKAGATDFVLKPWQNEKLLATLSAALEIRRSRKEISLLRNKQEAITAITDQPFQDFIAKSPEMEDVFNTIQKVAKTDANVLILGENGTGKELVARAIYRNSQRSNNVFVNVDLGSITETLFESELFGHVKGSFTDAKKDKPGRFEIASGGTLFLDEIGNLSLPLQAKLLTVIERKEVTRVGDNHPTNIDVRLICATNNNVYDMVENSTFRQDLLYRINTVEIHLPPLRERTGDIPVLVDHFVKIYAKKYKKNSGKVTSQALKKLSAYSWPGNVRELQHAIERGVIMCESGSLDADDFFLNQTRRKEAEMEIDTYNLDEVERKIITKVLKQNQGNISKAAKELGLTRTSLYRRMEKHEL
ncbi:MAG: sigma-54-dependent Fis family transcriptional regulator [Bacteroidota bacterium]|nr:MAG: sigma-54-dependent Fis family transcriptional regulator [Bacteroidota bacterium]